MSTQSQDTQAQTYKVWLTHTEGLMSTIGVALAVTLTYRTYTAPPHTQSQSSCTHTFSHGTRGPCPRRPLPVDVTQAWEGWEVPSDVFIAIVWDRKLPL